MALAITWYVVYGGSEYIWPQQSHGMLSMEVQIYMALAITPCMIWAF